MLIIYTAILTYTISCLRASGPLPWPVLTNPNPLHHPRMLPARNVQCRIHARPERTRPLTAASSDATRRPRECRPRCFPVHATALRSKVAIAGHNMHVKSSWESVLQLAFLPNSSISSCSASTPWRDLMTHKYRGSIVVLSISKSAEPNKEQKEMTSGFQ